MSAEQAAIPPAQTSPVQARLVLASNIVSWILLTGGISTAAVTLLITVLAYSPVPWMDPWFFLYQLDQGHLSIWQFLWAQHNGHRIVLPKLFDLADLYWAHGNSKLLLTSIYFVQILHCGILIYCLRKLSAFRGTLLRSAVGLLLFCIFSPAKREDFICGWEIAYVLPLFLATLAFSSFALASNRKARATSSPLILLGWLAALAGSFSLTSGFLIWPMLCLESTLLRFPKRVTAFTALFGVTTLALNLIAFEKASHADLSTALQQPGQVLSFFQLLMAESWQSASPLGAILAWAGIAACCGAMFWIFAKPHPEMRFDILLIVLALSAAAGAALTALARWNTGFTNRYEEPVLIFWLGIGLLSFSFANRARSRTGLLALQLVLLIAMVGSAGRVSALATEAKTHRQSLNLAGAALASNVMDPFAIQYLAMPADWTFGELSFLKRRNATFYSVPPANLFGTDVHRSLRIQDNACSGKVDRVQFLEDPAWPGFAIDGEAWNNRENKPLDAFVVTDPSGKVIGAGANDDTRVPFSSTPAARKSNWKSYAPVSARGKEIQVYGLLPNGGACPVAPPFKDQETPVSPRLDSARLTPLWSPAKGLPRVVGGTAALGDGVVIIRSQTGDTQAFFDTGTDLRRFPVVILKARFTRVDTVELFFGRQIDGRGMQGLIPVSNQWVLLRINVGLNPYWKSEAGNAFRFDPTGVQGPGATTAIAQIWGSTAPPSSNQPFEVDPAK